MVHNKNEYSKILVEGYKRKTIAEIETQMSSTIKLKESQDDKTSK